MKFGFPDAGTIQGLSAIPILLTFLITLLATSFTSDNDAPLVALAPAILCTNTVPAIPLLPAVYKLFSTATSSFTTT